MFTFYFKGYWVHGYIATDECWVQCPNYTTLGRFKSSLAAKRAINAEIRYREGIWPV